MAAKTGLDHRKIRVKKRRYTMIRNAIILATSLLISHTASAKDWIDKVDLVNDGIDLSPIDVVADKKKYIKTKRNKHRFNLRLFARAKPGKRIAGGLVGTNHISAFEASDDQYWQKYLSHRDVGRGSNKQVKIPKSFDIPIAKLRWIDGNPVQRCNQALSKKVQLGAKKSAVLKAGFDTSAYADIKFNAYAAWPGVAKNKSKHTYRNTSDKTKGMQYWVKVKCLSNNKRK